MRPPTCFRKPIVLLLFLFPLLILAQKPLVTTAPAPEWIKVFPFDTIKSPFNFDREHMHEERQINIESREEYIRHMYRIDSYDGIFNFHEIEFYPLFQNISIHTATIYRQDSVLNFIPNLRIYLDEKSKFSGNQLYLKTAQAKFFIENMRVGDYVEIAYTIHGFQKELKRKYATYAGPKAKNSENANIFRLIFDPKKRSLTHKILSSQEPLQVHTLPNDYEEWIWKLEGKEVYQSCVSCPGWYIYYPKIYITELVSHKEMLETQIAPFFIESNPSEHVLTKAKQLTSTKKDTAEKINIILSFIQKDIGYLSNEGVIPTRPETVLRQKFGDCKSKSLLAVNMLKSLGIESWPVIVASKGLDFRLNNLPSLSLYDHAIIEYRYKGQNYFFDTTFPEQGGNYTQKYVPNYMQGLRLSRDKELKVNINLNDPTKNIIHDSLYFGKNKKYIHIQRKTDFYGRDADNLRTIFSKGKEESVFSQIRNLNWWFSPYFTSLLDEEDSLSIFTFISYKDHFENNTSQNKVSIVFTRTYLRHRTIESYKKKKHTIKYKKEILLRMNHLTKYIKPFNKVPKGQKYIMLPFPLAIEHHIHFPKSWKIEKDLQKAKEICHDAFMYSYTRNNTGDHQIISFNLQTKQAYLVADSLNSYQSASEQVKFNSSFEFKIVE